jgi:hypothetical protein
MLFAPYVLSTNMIVSLMKVALIQSFLTALRPRFMLLSCIFNILFKFYTYH